MKKVKNLLLILVLSLLFCGKVNAAAVREPVSFEVGSTYIYDVSSTVVNSITYTDENLSIFKDPDAERVFITASKAGTYSAQVDTSDGTQTTLEITVTDATLTFSEDYISLKELAYYINNKDCVVTKELMSDIMGDSADMRPEGATKAFLQAAAVDNNLYVRVGYDVAAETIKLSYDDSTKKIKFKSIEDYGYLYNSIGSALTYIITYSMYISPNYEELMSLDFENEKIMQAWDDDSLGEKYGFFDFSVSSNNGQQTSSMELEWYLSKKINEDIIALYREYEYQVNNPADVVNPDEDNIVNPETGWFVSILIISLMGFVSLIIMKINKNRIYRI